MMAKQKLSEQAEEYLVKLLCDEADAERMEVFEIDRHWVRRQLQRIFYDYRAEYKQNTPRQTWQELVSWESNNLSHDTLTALAFKVKQPYLYPRY